MDTIIKRNYDRPVQNFSRRNERDVVPCYIFSISRIEESYFPLGWKKKKKEKKKRRRNRMAWLEIPYRRPSRKKDRSITRLQNNREKEYNVPLDVEKSMFST